jgi:hypothetical protein
VNYRPSPSWAARQIIIFILFLDCGENAYFGDGRAKIRERV